jgi:hypothetical protein
MQTSIFEDMAGAEPPAPKRVQKRVDRIVAKQTAANPLFAQAGILGQVVTTPTFEDVEAHVFLRAASVYLKIAAMRLSGRARLIALRLRMLGYFTPDQVQRLDVICRRAYPSEIREPVYGVIFYKQILGDAPYGTK